MHRSSYQSSIGRKWLVTFSTSKTEQTPPPVIMNGCTLNKRLLGHNLIPDSNWNLYIRSIAKDNGKCTGRENKSPAMLYIYKSQIRSEMYCFRCIWSCSILKISISLMQAINYFPLTISEPHQVWSEGVFIIYIHIIRNFYSLCTHF